MMLFRKRKNNFSDEFLIDIVNKRYPDLLPQKTKVGVIIENGDKSRAVFPSTYSGCSLGPRIEENFFVEIAEDISKNGGTAYGIIELRDKAYTDAFCDECGKLVHYYSIDSMIYKVMRAFNLNKLTTIIIEVNTRKMNFKFVEFLYSRNRTKRIYEEKINLRGGEKTCTKEKPKWTLSHLISLSLVNGVKHFRKLCQTG